MYTEGYNKALSDMGVEKTAAVSSVLRAPLMSRMGRALKQRLPSQTGIRDFLIGNPRRFRDELVSGKALGKNSLIRESFRSPGIASKAVLYGLPMVEAGGIALDSEGNKAQRLGTAVGSGALGLAAFRPLGLLGSMAASEVGSRIGGTLAGTGEHLGKKVLGSNIPQ
jgi:hypothetical protein